MSITIPSIKARSITSLTYPVSLRNAQRPSFATPQYRRYADEAATQSEPEADGATEAQHGDNSIAGSADTEAFTSIEEAEQSEPATDTESTSENAAEQASSAAAGSLKSAAESASAAVTGVAQSLGSAAGLGPPPPPEPSKSVYVGNLFFDVTGEDLRQEFAKAGPIVDTKIIMDPRGLSKGFVTSSFPLPP